MLAKAPRLLFVTAVVVTLAIVSMAVTATHQGLNGKKFGFAHQVASSGAVVSSESVDASMIGLSFLERDGNAIDAMVATTFAIGVTHPNNCGIGGGGVMVYYGVDGRTEVLDFREAAPRAMRPNTFNLGAEDGPGGGTNQTRPGLHNHGTGHLVVGVPGVVAGMEAALKELGSGKFTLEELIEPAENLATNGTKVPVGVQTFAALFAETLLYYPETARVYGPLVALGPAGLQNVVSAGNTVVNTLAPGQQFPISSEDDPRRHFNPDLGRSLRQIMRHGSEAFYTVQEYPGEGKSIGALLIKDMTHAQERATTNAVIQAKTLGQPNDAGLMTDQDLTDYKPIWRKPVKSTYNNHTILGAPPPFSGGAFVAETLNLLKSIEKQNWSMYSTDHIHYSMEAQKLAWADRNAYVADPAFVDVPTQQLVSEGYAKKRAGEIGERAKTVGDYGPGPVPSDRGGSQTTGYAIIDREGNAVAVTCTMNTSFGSGITPPGTGMLLNNQLLDFDLTWPDGNERPVNAPDGGKRPRSSMSPTIVLDEQRPALVAAGAGGTSIPMGVLQYILHVVDWNTDIYHAMDYPRFDAVAAKHWAPSSGTSCGPTNEPTGTPCCKEADVVGEWSRIRAQVAPLRERGHMVCKALENAEYVLPFLHAAGIDAMNVRVAMDEPRNQDRGAVGEAP